MMRRVALLVAGVAIAGCSAPEPETFTVRQVQTVDGVTVIKVTADRASKYPDVQPWCVSPVQRAVEESTSDAAIAECFTTHARAYEDGKFIEPVAFEVMSKPASRIVEVAVMDTSSARCSVSEDVWSSVKEFGVVLAKDAPDCVLRGREAFEEQVRVSS